MQREIASEVLAVARQVRLAEDALDRAKDRRDLAFALANERGLSSGDLARLTGEVPSRVQWCLRKGHRLIRERRVVRDAA